jgi:arabinogalactan oligomer/maltooligosaccharide transport system substrate-binding protein
MRSARMNPLRALTLGSVVLLVGAACGDDEPTTGATTTAPQTATSPAESPTPQSPTAAFEGGTLLIWADETRVPVLQPFADQFAEQFGVEVELQEQEFGNIRDQLLQSGPVGEGPDLIIGAHDWLGQLVAGGAVTPIDLGGKEEEFLDVAIQAFTYNGQLYGVPYAVENVALVRNTDLVPEAPGTWEELKQTALGLVDSGDADIGLGMQVPDPYHQYPLFSAAGGYVFGENDDGTYNPDDLGIDSEGGLQAAALFDQWTKDGLINADVTYDVMIEKFGNGLAPFAITGPWAVSQPDNGFKASGVPYVVEPIPPVEGGTPRPFVGVQGFMVSEYSENALIAQTFAVDFMTTDEAQLALYQAGGRPPALQSAFDQTTSDPDVQGFGLSGADGDPLPAIPEMSSVWTAWTDAYTLIFTQEADPQTAFQDAAAQIRNLIAG